MPLSVVTEQVAIVYRIDAGCRPLEGVDGWEGQHQTPNRMTNTSENLDPQSGLVHGVSRLTSKVAEMNETPGIRGAGSENGMWFGPSAHQI